MLLDNRMPMAEQVADRIAQVFGLQGIAVFDRTRDRVYRTDPTDQSISDAKLRDVSLQGTAFHDSLAKLSVLPLNLGGKALGSLAILGDVISETAVNAVGNLAAIAMERAQAEEAASRMEAARQNEEMKSMLLDALAHEFKTPLTSIKAAASSILDEEPSPHRELATIIDEETDRLDSLVNETIWMARIEAGDLHLQKSPHPVGDLVNKALEKLKILLKDREIEIAVMPNLPSVLVDVELAGLTLRQLVTNALKYSNPESPITIRAVLQDASVKISVKDCGPGIPEAELHRIFERYYRVKDRRERVPGTGMGLAIARNIVLAHGGEIWVDSTPGQGSEFFFTLPAVEKNERQEIS
jgi:two-component system sensor histidine kinase KdpD